MLTARFAATPMGSHGASGGIAQLTLRTNARMERLNVARRFACHALLLAGRSDARWRRVHDMGQPQVMHPPRV